MPDTILIVDDEESVRRTFRDWLVEARLDADILTAADAEEALGHAERSPIDLAVLDWNLGAGNDGLQLLEDLSVFHPDVVAILITGYAHQATPLVALRMGVRDYLDKSANLNRETFVAAVQRQLDKIAPAKRLREWHRALASFRSAVEQVLPLVRSSSALSDPVPLPAAAAALCRFVREAVGAADAVLFVRIASEGDDICRAYADDGAPLAGPFAPFDKSLAATVLSRGEPCILANLSTDVLGGAELQPFERGRKGLLATPLTVGSGTTAVLELFDKPSGFTADDRRLAAAAAEVGSALLQQAIGEHQTQATLFAAVEAALSATEGIAPIDAPPAPLPETVRDSLRSGLEKPGGVRRGTNSLELAEALNVLGARHGEPAVRHCLQLIESLTALLDEAAGAVPLPNAPR